MSVPFTFDLPRACAHQLLLVLMASATTAMSPRTGTTTAATKAGGGSMEDPLEGVVPVARVMKQDDVVAECQKRVE